MKIRDYVQMAPATKVLFLFVFFAQFLESLYSARQIAPPTLFEFLYPFAFLWMIWWWLNEDSRNTGTTWPLDLGMFLYVASIFLIPYYLFKTRGVRGFIGIAAFIGMLLGGMVCGAIVGVLIWY